MECGESDKPLWNLAFRVRAKEVLDAKGVSYFFKEVHVVANFLRVEVEFEQHWNVDILVCGREGLQEVDRHLEMDSRLRWQRVQDSDTRC